MNKSTLERPKRRFFDSTANRAATYLLTIIAALCMGGPLAVTAVAGVSATVEVIGLARKRRHKITS